MTLKIGLIVGREWSFPPAFIEEVNRRDEGVVAEYVTLGAPAMYEPCPYAVMIDRISHEVPFYRTYLKQAALQGCQVFWKTGRGDGTAKDERKRQEQVGTRMMLAGEPDSRTQSAGERLGEDGRRCSFMRCQMTVGVVGVTKEKVDWM